MSIAVVVLVPLGVYAEGARMMSGVVLCDVGGAVPCHWRPCLMSPRALFNCYLFDVTICVEHTDFFSTPSCGFQVFRAQCVCESDTHATEHDPPAKAPYRRNCVVHSICSETCVRSAVCDVVGSLRLCIFIIRFAMSLRCHRNAPQTHTVKPCACQLFPSSCPFVFLLVALFRSMSRWCAGVLTVSVSVGVEQFAGKRWRGLQVPPAAEATDDLDR